jgi:acyl-CoA thioesterase
MRRQSIQGVFTNPGRVDRPFIYEVSKIATGRTFSTRLVNVRQPTEPSENPDGPFNIEEADRPLADICFTCLTTFKRHSDGGADVQSLPSPQERYADILSQRQPDKWPPAPQVDLDIVRSIYTDEDHGTFPMFDMYKVDMTDYNKDKPVTERRELIYYRPSHLIDQDDVNAHIVCHGAESDRNGFLMLANYLGYGFGLSAVASLSYSFYIHVNPEEAVMDGKGWWIQEIEWPRAAANRGMMETRTWSPKGKHVASGYQDGLVVPSGNGPKDVKL